ncbi:metallophosphoesterase [Agromyces humi]|uniref:metallophosphoesterase n=1 Tax=Agromyces humi TaxID=1766800 RepID=UPI0013567C68|nr:metallophosphoesterase [Agromyces humi]
MLTFDWVTSDHHFSHARIIEFCDRPFSSVGHMNGELIRRWNSVVGPTDTVLHLGDLNLGPFDQSLALTMALNGDRVLMPGNHDRVSTATNKPAYVETFRKRYESAGWTVVDEIVDVEVSGQRRLLASHYPYRGDSRKDVERYAGHRPVDTGLPLLHGHTHSKEATRPGSREFHVGVDAHDFTPVHVSVIEAWLDTLP